MRSWTIGAPALLVALAACNGVSPVAKTAAKEDDSVITLPAPDTKGRTTLESVLGSRRSHRKYDSRPLDLAQVGQILWSGQGCTTKSCLRTAPSAGATFPLEILAVAGEGTVTGLEEGVYVYRPRTHALERMSTGDRRSGLAAAALGQSFIAEAPVTFVIAADPRRTSKVYGQRAGRYVHMEVGHAGQNICLEVEALGLGTVPVGAFDDAAVAKVIDLQAGLDALYLLPVGVPLD